ncbi:CaiB/BaiF CoA transferase family protein [Herbiconiux daphne]|uniref:CoA transferase n=1 Tax=Herbiconiux daphne TaxID=2970914 RepID=A0ABT2H711_9MICO|nr:CoA transferase [Herbiconiux daphne]MCS5735751.1 CoA transferase [Herbiconiux daphne]
MSTQPPRAPGSPPLSGLVVADLSRVLAGPYCTMLLADLGARVIKIESPSGDDTRAWIPPERNGEGTYFLSVNRNKQSIALDFSDAADLATAKQIVARADVVVENFKVGGLKKFGLDYASLSGNRPELIYASITGFGSADGADLPGYDLIAQAVSGIMDLTGQALGEPTKVGVALVDVITGLHALSGVLAAVYARDATGKGDHIQVDLLSSALSGLVNQTAAYVTGGVVPRRMGNAHPSLYPYEPFPARDKDIVIAVGNDGQFSRLCHVLGTPQLALDTRFATMSARNGNRQVLRELLCERLATRDAQHWFEALSEAQVPAAPILTVAEGVNFAESLGLDPVVETGGAGRRIPTIRHPVSFARASVDYSKAPPRLDEDRVAVLDWLGSGR